MQNHLMNSFARIGSAFAFAALAGCSTISSNPTQKDEGCIVGQESQQLILGAIPFKKDAPEQYSMSCREGRAAAYTTIVGRDKEGNLYPKAAAFALTFNKEILGRIKTSGENGEKTTQKYYQDVKYFFDFYLQKLGGQTVDKIQEYVDKLRADAAAARAQESAPQSSPPKAPPKCETGSSIIRSCGTSKIPTPNRSPE